MLKNHNVYLSTTFQSPEKNGFLQTIKVHGVPGQELKDGKCTIDNEMLHFCTDAIVGKIFRRSLALKCEFQHLEIWLYDSNIDRSKISYLLPEIDEYDLLITSKLLTSKLKQIYVLDNKLDGDVLRHWHKEVESLFQPLFEEFVMMPDNLKSFPILKNIESVTSKVIPHYEMKQNLFFDTLIVQVD
jgi:hypothetical protein